MKCLPVYLLALDISSFKHGLFASFDHLLIALFNH